MSIFTPIKVLDQGYVQLIESWGSDERIIESARMSTNKGFQGWDTDEKLLAYLYNNKHLTPFEMCGLTLEIKAPIFIFREWHRHRTQSYNEMSARYTPLPDENYLPTPERLFPSPQSTNKQAQSASAHELTSEEAKAWLLDLAELYHHAQAVYEDGIRLGIPKEIARLPVPVARYSRMRASANLRNWLAFLTLRDDSHAQWEIQQFAKVVSYLISQTFLRTHKLYAQGR